MTTHRRHYRQYRRPIRTMAEKLRALRSRDARQHLATLATLCEETQTQIYDAQRNHEFMRSQDLQRQYLWLDGKRRDAAGKLKQGVTR